jgi:hypothetical protein
MKKHDDEQAGNENKTESEAAARTSETRRKDDAGGHGTGREGNRNGGEAAKTEEAMHPALT